MPHNPTREGGANDAPETWTVERCRRILARKSPERTWTDGEIILLRDTLVNIATLQLKTLQHGAR